MRLIAISAPVITSVLASVVSLALCLALPGCGGAVEPTPPPASAEPDPAPPPLDPPSGTDPFEGTWWVGARELPTFGLRLDVRATRVEGTYSGQAVAFDWRGSEAPLRLFRPTRPVTLTAHRKEGRTEISGPVPQVDAAGRPNGQEGHWLLELVDAQPAGGPRRMTGQLMLTDRTSEVGTAVEVSREFRPWSGP